MALLNKLTAINRIAKSLVIFLLALILSLGIDAQIQLQAQTSESAAALVRESKEYYDRGQFDIATTTLKQAVQSYKNNNDRFLEARTLSLLSLAYEQLGMMEFANSTITDALSLLNDVRATPAKNLVRAQILNRQGTWQLTKGQPEAAIATLETAEKFYTRADDTQGVFISKINQAQAWQSLGFFRRATKILDKLNAQLQSQPASIIKLNSLNSLGELFRQQGNFASAEKTLTQSLSLAQQLNLDTETSKVLFNLGNTKLALANRARDLGDLLHL